MLPSAISIILSRPQMGENIGAAARALANFGLADLRIVAPRDGWPSQAAEDMAAGAFSRVGVSVFDDLPAALADLNFVYATTARAREINKPVFTPRQAAQASFSGGQGKTGFLFGCERTGLENDELSLCHAMISIPVDPDFASINLAQAVLLIAYECFAVQSAQSAPPAQRAENLPASHEELNGFIDRLIAELSNSGFFKTDAQRPTMERNIRAMLTRPGFSEQELRTLHGMITALRKI